MDHLDHHAADAVDIAANSKHAARFIPSSLHRTMLYMILFFVSVLSLAYELLLSTQGSYLLGSSIVVFSLTIGFFLLGLGIGSYLGGLIRHPKRSFFYLEIYLGILGGASLLLLKRGYLAFGNISLIYRVFFLLLVVSIGILTGCEAPLIAAIIDEQQNPHPTEEKKQTRRTLFSHILSVDYIGSLVATLLFPFTLLPLLGLEQTAIALGATNLIIAGRFGYKYYKKHFFLPLLIASIIYISTSILQYAYFKDVWNTGYFASPIIYSQQSSYQHITMTKDGNDITLFLDGHIQFSSRDHHRYHNALTRVVPLRLQHNSSKNTIRILILGGGDGLATDTIRSHIDTYRGSSYDRHIDLIELDPAILHLASTHTAITTLNNNIFADPRVHVTMQDAFSFVRSMSNQGKQYDIIIADFPDPRTTELATLYSKEIYHFIRNIIAPNGVFATHGSHAYITNDVYACIVDSITQAFAYDYTTTPYHVYLPSFGDWGFSMVVPEKRTGYTQPIDAFDTDYTTTHPCKSTLDYNELPILYHRNASHR